MLPVYRTNHRPEKELGPGGMTSVQARVTGNPGKQVGTEAPSLGAGDARS